MPNDWFIEKVGVLKSSALFVMAAFHAFPGFSAHLVNLSHTHAYTHSRPSLANLLVTPLPPHLYASAALHHLIQFYLENSVGTTLISSSYHY